MPFIRVSMIPRSQEVKKALAKDIAEVVMKHCSVGSEHVWIVFDEPPKSSWSFGGRMASE